MVVWSSDGQDGDSYGIYGQRYNVTGQPEDSEFQVNGYTTLSQQEILDNKIQFRHDGSSIAPTYEIKVNEDPYQIGVVSFIPINDAPQIISNQLEITRGKSVVLTSNHLSAIDEDNNNATLIFTAYNVTHGRFEKIDDRGKTILEFNQQQIFDKQIQFTHESASGLAPSYALKVSDGELDSPYSLADITYHHTKTLPTAAIVISSLLGAACLLVTATGVCLIIAGSIYIANIKKNSRKLLHDVEFETLDGSLDGPLKLSSFMKNFNVDPSEIKVTKIIGQGGEGSVYRAKWSNKTVAYKVTNISDPSAISEFEKEAKIMLESNHPNIVHVYRICLTPGKIGLVMEFMALGSLRKAIDEKSIELTWESKWNIAYDLASVVDFLHGQEIVHRDIKTDNLLLYQESGDIHAKLADFGLSKGKQSEQVSVTMGIGTYKYMAPEMVLGDGRYSEKATDVYAIGMTFVAMVNEEEPYPELRNAMHIPAKVGKGEYWQKLVKNKCSPLFFKLTNQCRNINQDGRPTAKYIVKQLEKMRKEVVTFDEDEEIKFSKERPLQILNI